MPQRKAFTLVELLVVIGIIAVLVAMLLPALAKARYAGLEVNCMSNIRQQYLAQLSYANDNEGKYCERREDSPDYQRESGFAGSCVSLMHGGYLPDARVMVCPIVAMIDNDFSSGGAYQRNDWLIGTGAGSYGGWDTNAANVYDAYMWLGGFKGTTPLTMVGDELPPPMGAWEGSSADRAFITHRLNYYFDSSLHEICHGGRGLGLTGTPYTGFHCPDMPVGYSDGSVRLHRAGEILPRMVLGGSYPGFPGYPGTYLW